MKKNKARLLATLIQVVRLLPAMIYIMLAIIYLTILVEIKIIINTRKLEKQLTSVMDKHQAKEIAQTYRKTLRQLTQSNLKHFSLI